MTWTRRTKQQLQTIYKYKIPGAWDNDSFTWQDDRVNTVNEELESLCLKEKSRILYLIIFPYEIVIWSLMWHGFYYI